MKRQIKYRVFSIPKKLSLELRLIFDTEKDRGNVLGEFNSNSNGDMYTVLSVYPLIMLTITRQGEPGENGQFIRPPFNPNDSLSMTRYNYSIFTLELERIYESMKVPEMYSYVGKKLQLNEDLAEKARRVFKIGPNMVVEMSPVTLVSEDDSKLEGVKLKFNNEQSSVLLTVNDLEALLFILKTLNVDAITLGLHANYLRDRNMITTSTPASQFNLLNAEVDILPKGD